MGSPNCMLSSLSVLVPHSYSCRIELLIEFPNKHPFMQKALISKANSTKGFMGVSKQGTCITCLAANGFRIHKDMSSLRSHCLTIPRWCPPPSPCYCSMQDQLFWLILHLLYCFPPPTHLQTKMTK